jgi:hypothetical protein
MHYLSAAPRRYISSEAPYNRVGAVAEQKDEKKGGRASCYKTLFETQNFSELRYARAECLMNPK